ncbi:MAG: hypothetical protein ACO26G_05690, partial [Rickettsiales bacterium]
FPVYKINDVYHFEKYNPKQNLDKIVDKDSSSAGEGQKPNLDAPPPSRKIPEPPVKIRDNQNPDSDEIPPPPPPRRPVQDPEELPPPPPPPRRRMDGENIDPDQRALEEIERLARESKRAVDSVKDDKTPKPE